MNIRTISITGGVFLLGLMTGGIVSSWEEWFSKEDTIEHSKQVRQVGEYRYTNPLLECEVAEGTIDAKKQNSQDDLAEQLDRIKSERRLTEVAVYFRDLNNGPAFGIDETGEFFPASLLKVPVMMAYLRWSEQEPGLLERGVVYEQARDFGVTLTIQPREELEPGLKYSVDELIRRMIVYSDNQSLALLTDRLPRERIHELFDLLGIGEDVLVDAQGKLTVKEYAGFFRILFNSSYLSRENSEKALLLLSSTDFNDALPAGIPAGTPVAHKFGEAGTGESERQLHDCGIVYFPDHPYLACIMTRGKDLDGMKQAIRDVSGFIYQKIDEQY